MMLRWLRGKIDSYLGNIDANKHTHFARLCWWLRRKLKYRVGKFLCPRRESMAIFSNYPKHDHWELDSQDLTCSFCGCWHPDEFFSWCHRALDGQEEGTLELADGRHKIYINRPGVPNASVGAIKFYVDHCPAAQYVFLEEAYRKLKWKPKMP